MGIIAFALRLHCARVCWLHPARVCGRISTTLAVLMLCACSSHVTSNPAPFITRCVTSSGQSESTLTLSAPTAGVLRVEIEEKGLVASAVLDGDPASAVGSPIERVGILVLTADTAPQQAHRLTIRAEDSPDLEGRVCLRAEVLRPGDTERIDGERLFMFAGHATQAKEWPLAFESYLGAARIFDRLHRWHAAGAARHAMAELAYHRLAHERDAYALAGEALADYAHDGVDTLDPALVGSLTGERAKALLYMPGSEPRVVAQEVRSLLVNARRSARASHYGGREVARLDILTGYLDYRLDAVPTASAVFASVARDCQALKDWVCYAMASQNLAAIAEGSDYATALAAYGEVLRRLPPQLDPKLHAEIWSNLARIQGAVGLFSASERSNEAAMREYAALGDCAGIRRSLSRTGTLLSQVGLIGDAESDLQGAATLDCPELFASAAQRTTATVDAPTRASLPAAAIALSRVDDSSNLCANPVDATSTTDDDRNMIFNSLLSLGNVLMLQGYLPQAQRCFQSAGQYVTEARSQTRLENADGALHLEQADAGAAQAAFTRALQAADSAGLPPMYEHRGPARFGIVKAELLAGEGASTLPQSYKALEYSLKRGDLDQTVTSLRLLAAGYRASGQLTEASHALRTAIGLIEAVPIDELNGERRATYLATQYGVFSDLTDLLAAQADANPESAWLAFSMSERGRARSLRYALTQTARNAQPSLAAPPASRYQQMLRDVVQLASSVSNPGGAGLLSGLDRASQNEGTAAPEMLDRAELTGALGRLDATLVEYAAGSRDMFAFIIDRNKVQVLHLGDRHAIASAAAELREALRDPESARATVRSAAVALARLVLWPVTGQVSSRRLLFVPYDALYTIPFDVLPWSAGAPEQLLLQRAEASVIPSAGFLLQAHPRARDGAAQIELIGDPVFRVADWRRECAAAAAAPDNLHVVTRTSDWGESLPRLPGSREEVQAIARLAHEAHPDAHVDVALGCAAVPSAMRRAAIEHVALLHVATHARVDAQRPRLSAVALTPEGGDEPSVGTFTLLDILGLKLDSSVVVLSACDTSRGRLLPGEGVLGPAQAFLEAGAATVIATYWRIDDQLTARFMQLFYKRLLIEHQPAATALRQAQLDAAATSSSHVWAAFALYGWPDSGI